MSGEGEGGRVQSLKSPHFRKGRLERVKSKRLKVGDIVAVKNKETFPCDLLILATSSLAGKLSSSNIFKI